MSLRKSLNLWLDVMDVAMLMQNNTDVTVDVLKKLVRCDKIELKTAARLMDDIVDLITRNKFKYWFEETRSGRALKVLNAKQLYDIAEERVDELLDEDDSMEYDDSDCPISLDEYRSNYNNVKSMRFGHG